VSQFERMNPVAKELWLAALRSGEREQGKGYLNVSDKFCCLGVLCEVAIESGVVVEKEKDQVGADHYYYYGGRSSYPPQAVYVWSGLGGLTTANGPDMKLSTLNDHDGKTFLEIADWIEENL